MQQDHRTIFALEDLQSDWLSVTQRCLYQWSIRLSSGLFFVLALGLSFGLLCMGIGSIKNQGPSLIIGLVSALIIALTLVQRGYGNTKIHPAEVVRWTTEKPPSEPYYEPIVKQLGWTGFEWIGRQLDRFRDNHGGRYLVREQLIERSHLSPNEGIWLSARNGLLHAIPFGVGFGLLTGSAYENFGLVIRIVAGVISGISFWMVIAMIAGVDAFFEHFALLFFLWCLRDLPWNLVPFLDEVTNRLLLRKVGGGYMFIHRLLLDYFASLDQPRNSKSEKEELF